MKRVARSSRGRPIQRPIEQLVRLSGSCMCFAITETAAIASYGVSEPQRLLQGVA
jgi:hypothetical protein